MKRLLPLLFLLVGACGIVTGALRMFGVPVSDGATEKAREVDEKLTSWFWEILFGGTVAAVGAAKGGHVYYKRRKAKRNASPSTEA